MRPIKFRAWDDYHKKMLVVHNLYQHMDANGFTEFECTPNGWSKDGKDYILVSTTAHDNVHIMQYVGLKDKNGVEGYHKDIVQMGPFLFTIEWDDKAAKFYLKSTNSVDTMKYTMTHFTRNGFIVGNSFENPDLLHRGEAK